MEEDRALCFLGSVIKEVLEKNKENILYLHHFMKRDHVRENITLTSYEKNVWKKLFFK